MCSDVAVPERLAAALDDGDSAALDAIASSLDKADPETHRSCTNCLRSVADDNPSALGPACPVLTTLFTSEDRSVRLTATKATAKLAAADPHSVTAIVPAVTDLLADEFYYVRGRAAQALGYVGQAEPDALDQPTVLARLLNALSLDRPETRQYVAETLARITFGDPSAVRTVVDDFGQHMDDEDELVRYYLTTAVAVVAIDHSSYCRSLVDSLCERLDDDNPYVRGRAAEALGLLTAHDTVAADAEEQLHALTDDDSFVADRAAFALGGVGELPDESPAAAVGNVAAIADATTDIVDDITTSDGEDCPHCGEHIGDGWPPFCPACGAPLQSS